jgi:hypothetical protein
MGTSYITGKYTASPVAGADGQDIQVAVDQYGNVKTAGAGTAGSPSGGVQTVQGLPYASSATFTRQNNSTPYDAGDVVGALAAALTFSSIGPSGGGHVMITKAELQIDVSAVPAGMAGFTLHLYSVTPPSALADAAAWDLPSGDRASYLGEISLGTPVDKGSTLYVKTTQINDQFVIPSGGALFGYLATVGAYTPTAVSVYTIKFKTVGI